MPATSTTSCAYTAATSLSICAIVRCDLRFGADESTTTKDIVGIYFDAAGVAHGFVAKAVH